MLQAINTWQFIGPVNLPTAGGTQVRNGRINAVAFDPKVQRTYYAGAPSGGVWKTTNGGQDWTPLTDNWKFLCVNSIAVEPANTQHLYVGTGDVPKQGPYAMGLMRSQDGGMTWQPIGPPELSSAMISRVIVDPDAPNIVLAAEFGPGGRIWRSTTYGDTWSVAIATQTWWTDIQFGPMAAHWYAVGEGYGGGELWHSQDHGANWSKLASPLRAHDQRGQPLWQQRPLVAASPVFPQKLYIFSQTDQKVFVSGNNAGTWKDITGNYSEPSATILYTFCMACSYMQDPSSGKSEDVVFLGQYGVSASLGDGHWQQVAYDNAHADQHAIAVDPFIPQPSPTTGILIGNDGGVYYALYGQGGAEIASLNAKLAVAECYAASYSQQARGVVIAGLQDTGSAAAVGDLNAWTDVTGGDGGNCQIMKLSPTGNLQYATVNFGDPKQMRLYRTADLWASQQDITNNFWRSEPGAVNSPVVLDPSRPWLLYVATNYLYLWTDTGAVGGTLGSWNDRLGGQKLSSGGWVNVIEVCQADFNRIYTGSTDREIWMSTDAGATWRRIDTPGLPSAQVRTISSHPNNPNEILIGLWVGSPFSHIWRCLDTRNPVWHDVGTAGGLPDIPVESIVRDIWDPTGTWYVGTDTGVYCTDDAGGHWTSATTPVQLPNSIVQQLTIDSLNQFIYAATFGRGLWKNTLTPPPQMTLTLNTHVLPVGGSTAGTLTFDTPAPITGAHVTMISTNPAVIVDPTILTVPVNGKLGIFKVIVGPPIAGFPPIATIFAVYGGKTASAVIQIV